MYMVSNPSQHSAESTELVPPESIILLRICTVKIVLFRQQSDSDSVEFYSVRLASNNYFSHLYENETT
jgi:hypothetical protein